MEQQLRDKYVKLEQREHVLARPSMYVGSVETDTISTWICERVGAPFTCRSIQYNAGLYKIFDEVLVNAIDHSVRMRDLCATDSNAKPVRNIKVTISRDSGTISVWNDGDGLDVQLHPDHEIYVPELLFGSMLTSTNYDDSEERLIGGQNGIGAKATNIFSAEFSVETNDHRAARLFRQSFSDNMSSRAEPKVTKSSRVTPYTCITFKPDYPRFGMPNGLTDDMYALMLRRACDAAAVTDKSVAITVNGEKLPVKTFRKYIQLYLGGGADAADGGGGPGSANDDGASVVSDAAGSTGTADTCAGGSEAPLLPAVAPIYEEVSSRMEVAVAHSSSGFQQVSFVNGIATLKGGKHVDAVVAAVVKGVSESIKKRKKLESVRPHLVRDQLFVFVNCSVPNPTFDSQSKECLTTPASRFGYKVELSDAFIAKVCKSPIADAASSAVDASSQAQARKTDGRKSSTVRGIAKLEDAEYAGTAQSERCTLILTEGDSAKSMAITGLSQVGRDYYGVFPLKGKLLNVKDVSVQRVSDNEEISHLKRILGLEAGRQYHDLSSLRYGKVCIMTDADHDGSHIKGLLFNLFHTLWPSLLRQPSFITSLLTPIVKARGPGGVSVQFFNQSDYERWRASLVSPDAWKIKYYKGLGTSTADEAKEYFRNMNMVEYLYSGKPSDDKLDLAFNKKRAEDRKRWLGGYDRSNVLTLEAATGASGATGGEPADEPTGAASSSSKKARGATGASAGANRPPATLTRVVYEDFVDKDLIHFSNADNYRSIPSVMDGLKVSQRKILFGCLKKNLFKDEVRVAQLAGYISEQACYHHGEASLQAAIIGMAQDFVGSNNINLLRPIGQFGTRLQGGKDAGSPRYIHTCLDPIVATLFRKEDVPVLHYLDDDGTPVEPDFYAPVIPFILVNGALGIGTGFSTSVPCHDPLEVAALVRALLGGEQGGEGGLTIAPRYRSFTGSIVADQSRGVWTVEGDSTVAITELPLGTWTDDYKAFLEDYMSKHPDVLKGYKSNKNSHVAVNFTLQLAPGALAPGARLADPAVFEKEFKLVARNVTTTNMHLIGSDGAICKYPDAVAIVREFVRVRLDLYVRRRQHEITRLQSEVDVLLNKVRFVESVVEGGLVLMRRKRADLEAELQALGFAEQGGSYMYLLGMNALSFTHERIEQLQQQLCALTAELAAYSARTPQDIWLAELAEFEAAYGTFIDAHEEYMANQLAVGAPESASKGASRKGAAGSSTKRARVHPPGAAAAGAPGAAQK
ncbi:hypothetical protein HXX76_014168 [Chlamydomonas incerta]|uniref:DNA topoisomerase 2 n=1 Tax=Chlamydomonas incerta TaxID=51695 RepID=A0A835SQL7_CHLIN|nr:hypothetical protein HXX76_014168 [Chlamydomonas incerta]|eukprot:KAG2425010.1 hypothetical protein HXX76_014168 [Chlamydomonas incerta]